MPNGVKLKGKYARADLANLRDVVFQIYNITAAGEKLVQEQKILADGFNLPNDPTKPAAWQVRFSNLARKKLHRLVVTETTKAGVSTVRLRRVFKTFDAA